MGLGSHIPRFDLHPQHICFSEFATRKKTWIKKSRGSLTLEKMSRINKLSILGVRSFDNTRAEAIQFHTPLTLIVGYNGSGKTTIIECLKYSTTGELPPNSKGGAFIHDPSLCGEKEVLAQVKLSFQNTSGEQMVITRNLQLTVKKNTRQQKTLEGSLLTKTRNGERTSISSRVAELDLVMPHHLGVSKAVLDFVIFCHQDESLWPMSEPAPLKKKFDEIFEALKYTKAIDNIKLLRKTKAEELKRLKDNEIHSKEIKNKGDKAEKHSRVLHAAICEIRDEIEDHEIKAKEADRKYQDASDRAAQYTTIIGQLDNHQAKKTWLQDSLDRLGKNLKKRDESDEWLQSEFNQYEERVDGYRTLEERQMQQYQGLERCSKSAEAKLSGKHVEAGKYEEQKANHEQQIEKRKVLVKETSRQHNIRGYDTELDDVQINEYMDKICRLSKDQNAAVEKARRETEREMGKIQNALNKLGERRSVLEENKNAAKEQLSANSGLLRTRQVELNNIETDEGSRAILEADTGDIEVRLKRAREDSDRASWDSKTKENEIQLRMLNDESGQLNEDYHQRTKQAGELAKLDQLKRDAADCQRNLDKMEAVHSDRLKIVVGHNWKPSDLERHFDRAMDQKGRYVKEAERERGVVSRGLEQVDYKLTNVKTDLRKAEKELATCIKHLNNNVDGDPEDYTETLSNIQDARDLFKADFDNFENTRQYFAKGITVAQGKHQCNLCQRAFHGKEMTDFVKKMEEKLAKLTAEKVAKDLEEAEEDLRKAKAAGPSHDTWLRLSKTELPRLHEEAKKLTAEREKMLREVENHDKIVKDKEEAKMDAESLAKPVANIVKYQNDLTRFSGQMNESVASNQDSDMHRTLDEIRDQLHTLQSKVQDKRNEIDRLKTDKERARSLISTLELDLSKANNKLSTATHELEKKQTISRQIGELRIAKQGRQNTIREIEVKLQDLAPQCAEEETKMQDIRRRGLDKENDLHQESVRLLDSVQQLKLAAKNIALYVDDGGSAKLDKCGREIKGIEQEISGIKDEQRQVTISINKIKKELNDQDTTKDTILKNIEYRRSLKDLERVKTEIAELSAQNDEVDREHWLKQRAYWERSLNEHTTQRTSKLGTARAKDDELVRLLEDWKTEYKDAARNFKKAHIEVETTKAAIDDLGRYASALDKAIMKYHGIKMEEINRIIEELWKKTYQGTDVDTILIRSDNEGARQNRSYNYRVCMVKQDAEMDMRGRCSAGQKVLASIIIRLALAECFGVNCGLIALDEPTTNLDRDNIRSLATSLHDIIEARRHQSNFQLIVITHDEEFLKEMKCPDFCDHYYRVSRSERQKSTIEKQSIADVM